MRKLFFLLAIFALALSAQDAQPPAGGGGRGAGGGRGPQGPAKNLKVLTEDELRGGAMRQAATGLGVMCTYCHNQAAFDSDEIPAKVTARAMFAMVKDINGKFPDGKAHVTCYTCHRGAEMPLTAPPPAAAGEGRGAGGGGGRGRGGPPPEQN